MWMNVVEGMTAYSPEELKQLLENAGFHDVVSFSKKPSYATIKAYA